MIFIMISSCHRILIRHLWKILHVSSCVSDQSEALFGADLGVRTEGEGAKGVPSTKRGFYMLDPKKPSKNPKKPSKTSKKPSKNTKKQSKNTKKQSKTPKKQSKNLKKPSKTPKKHLKIQKCMVSESGDDPGRLWLIGHGSCPAAVGGPSWNGWVEESMANEGFFVVLERYCGVLVVVYVVVFAVVVVASGLSRICFGLTSSFETSSHPNKQDMNVFSSKTIRKEPTGTRTSTANNTKDIHIIQASSPSAVLRFGTTVVLLKKFHPAFSHL